MYRGGTVCLLVNLVLDRGLGARLRGIGVIGGESRSGNGILDAGIDGDRLGYDLSGPCKKEEKAYNEGPGDRGAGSRLGRSDSSRMGEAALSSF